MTISINDERDIICEVMKEKKAEKKYEDCVAGGQGVVIMRSPNNQKDMY